MNRHRPLTVLAHELLGARIQPGDKCIDATAGNGHDTLFLAQRVGKSGAVYAFDVQDRALESAAQRLREHENQDQVTLCHSGHENMATELPVSWREHVSAITYNLGYLPGGDKQITTLPASTLQALEQSLELLQPGGVLSILAYRGHPGGQQEADAVAQWLQAQTSLDCQIHESPGPVLYHAIKVHNNV